AGLLIAPSLLLYPTYMDQVLVFGFTGAILGGLDSPPGAVVGGLSMGFALSYVGGYFGSDLDTVGALVLLIAVLMVRPRGRLCCFGVMTCRFSWCCWRRWPARRWWAPSSGWRRRACAGPISPGRRWRWRWGCPRLRPDIPTSLVARKGSRWHRRPRPPGSARTFRRNAGWLGSRSPSRWSPWSCSATCGRARWAAASRLFVLTRLTRREPGSLSR